MKKITILLIVALFATLRTWAQNEPFLASHLFMSVSHFYVNQDDDNVHFVSANIWLDDYEIKIIFEDKLPDEYQFEDEITAYSENDYSLWAQDIKNIKTNDEYRLVVLTPKDRPNIRYITFDSPDKGRVIFVCEVISAKHY